MNSQMKSAIKIVLDMYISEELDNFGGSYDAGCSKEDLKDLFESHILYSLLMLKHEGDVNNVNKEFEIFWSEIDPEDEDSEDEDSEDEEVLKCCYKCSSTTKLHEYAPPPNGSGKIECDVCTTAESNRLKAESIRQEPKRGFGIHQTPCSTPCTPRYDFIGRSWNKRMGYNSTCKCAFLEADKRGLLEPNGVFFTEESGVDNPIRGCV